MHALIEERPRLLDEVPATAAVALVARRDDLDEGDHLVIADVADTQRLLLGAVEFHLGLRDRFVPRLGEGDGAPLA